MDSVQAAGAVRTFVTSTDGGAGARQAAVRAAGALAPGQRRAVLEKARRDSSVQNRYRAAYLLLRFGIGDTAAKESLLAQASAVGQEHRASVDDVPGLLADLYAARGDALWARTLLTMKADGASAEARQSEVVALLTRQTRRLLPALGLKTAAFRGAADALAFEAQGEEKLSRHAFGEVGAVKSLRLAAKSAGLSARANTLIAAAYDIYRGQRR